MMIDADAHVIESEETWEYLEGAERKFKPRIVAPPQEDSQDEFWLIDERVHIKSLNVGRDTPRASRELRDVAERLKHMDELGVDIQVLYPTVFLMPVTNRSDVEVALCRSYNRWLADACKEGKGRLRWTAVLPLLSMQEALEEARFAKRNGACGIFIRGTEGERLLSDPYFLPLYEEVERLDIPLCVHSASGSFSLFDFYRYEPVGFSKFKLVIVGAFHSLILAGIPQKFPGLKMAFLEVSAQWLPYVFRDLTKRFRMEGREFKADLLSESRIYVGVETNDDLPYIVQNVGDDNLVIGSDYGHADSATELKALERLRVDTRLSATATDKILNHNPKALYGL
jgi:uncharacterized protein